MSGWAGFWIGAGLVVVGFAIQDVGAHVSNALTLLARRIAELAR
jgi:hypothetical protein